MTDRSPVVLEVVLPHDATAPRRTRQALAEALDDAVSAECQDVVALLATEVVTNALLHGLGPLVLRLWLPGRLVRVAVHDASRQEPAIRNYGGDASTGRGLQLVHRLSTRWGVDRDVDGKSVWFEVSGLVDPFVLARAALEDPLDGQTQ